MQPRCRLLLASAGGSGSNVGAGAGMGDFGSGSGSNVGNGSCGGGLRSVIAGGGVDEVLAALAALSAGTARTPGNRPISSSSSHNTLASAFCRAQNESM